MFTPLAFRSVLPEILVLGIALVVLVVETLLKDERRRSLGWLTAVGLLGVMAAAVAFGLPDAASTTFGTTIRFDWLAFVFKLLFLFGGAITALLLMDHPTLGRRGEAYLLMLASIIGMCLMAAAADLVMLYLAIETTSIPLYVLAGFMLADDRSTEAGFKYLLFGAMASAVMLYGFSLLYGFAGTTNLYSVASGLRAPSVPPAAALGIILLIIIGLGFKLSIVPFHFWAPDVYEGAPTPIAGFLSTASKAAAFAVVARLFVIAFPTALLDAIANWRTLLAVLAAVTMTVGNLLALPQRNLKRLLAYSSIAHAGYALIGLVALSKLGIASVALYMLAYLVTNMAAFGIVTAVGRVSGSDDYDAYRGLSRRSPALALSMLVAFLSLAGMPPFAGFIAKVLVFAAGLESGFVWLVVVGVLNSVVGLFYYLNVMKYVYLFRMEGEDEVRQPVVVTRPQALALAVLTIGILVVGTVIAPWFGYAAAAAATLFS